jgi:hypothetical protein
MNQKGGKLMRKSLGILGIVLLAFAILALPGCKGKSAAERAAEKALEKATGGKAEVDLEGETVSIKTEEGEVRVGALTDWPADLPGDVPRFEGGKVKNAAKTDMGAENGWIVNLSEVEVEAVDKYLEELKTAGFSSDMISRTEDTIMFQGTKSDVSIMVAYVKNDKGLSLNVTKKK